MNGIVQATPVDLDGDHITDYVYAGDVQGNVWRFDLTSSSAASWTVPSSPMFKTQTGQPITSGLAVDALIPATDKGAGAFTTPIVVVAFGTGQKLPKTLTSDTSYPTTTQSLYGIWDANMGAWNAKAATQFQYASLSSPPTIVPGTGSGGNLLQHVITTTTSGTRTTDTNTVVCWKGTTACTAATNNQMGWELDLSVVAASGSTPAVAEQALFNPLIVSHFFNTNTDIPVVAQALTCDKSSETQYSIGISMATGSAGVGIAGVSTTDANGVTNFSYFSGYAVGTMGVATQATGTSSAVTASDGSQWLVFQKGNGTGGTLGISPPPGSSGVKAGERVNWTKMR
jgi:type IV pilus assembly protein PilY1